MGHTHTDKLFVVDLKIVLIEHPAFSLALLAPTPACCLPTPEFLWVLGSPKGSRGLLLPALTCTHGRSKPRPGALQGRPGSPAGAASKPTPAPPLGLPEPCQPPAV